MSASRTRGAWHRVRAFATLITLPLLTAIAATQGHAASFAPITGEIQSIRINDPNDHWSGGTMVVGGQNVTLPRNLLIDLPANRLTLQELFAQAPANCLAAGQTGLAKADTCNASPVGAIANIHANRTGGGNIIAGDVFIQKGIEAVMGTITYIDYTDGYFRVNGNVGDPATGAMVRLNDPDGRHTVQQGLGCAAGNAVNCSPDPRFTLDGDNYTNVFSTGFPLCIPSTVARTVTTGLPTTPSGIAGIAAGTVAQSSATGTGDVLCPDTNRGTPGQPVQDSRRFAPIQVGDSINAEGNFEKVDGVQFLSAHTTMVSRALTTKSDLSQPDYLFLDEVEIDLAGFQNQRIRTLIIGFATLAPTDVNVWTIHYDPTTNAPHEFPLASVVGCDIAAGPGTCGAQGLVGAGANIFKIRHDVDFLVGAKARLNPCAHLRADPFFAPLNICPNGGSAELNLTEMVGILTPIPHEIQARTGHALRAKAAGVVQVTLDLRGNLATNGQYLFPFGLGLGGIAAVEFVEINLDGIATPILFSAMPWNLDRRLSPGGCIDTDGDGVPNCESTPQPLDPFPFEELDPRLQANLPTGSYNDPNYTAAPIGDVRNRILSFVDAAPSRPSNGFDAPASGNFNGNALHPRLAAFQSGSPEHPADAERRSRMHRYYVRTAASAPAAADERESGGERGHQHRRTGVPGQYGERAGAAQRQRREPRRRAHDNECLQRGRRHRHLHRLCRPVHGDRGRAGRFQLHHLGRQRRNGNGYGDPGCPATGTTHRAGNAVPNRQAGMACERHRHHRGSDDHRPPGRSHRSRRRHLVGARRCLGGTGHRIGIRAGRRRHDHRAIQRRRHGDGSAGGGPALIGADRGAEGA